MPRTNRTFALRSVSNRLPWRTATGNDARLDGLPATPSAWRAGLAFRLVGRGGPCYTAGYSACWCWRLSSSPGGAAERVADGGQGAEPKRAGPAVVQDRQIRHGHADPLGQLDQGHAARRADLVQVH